MNNEEFLRRLRAFNREMSVTNVFGKDYRPLDDPIPKDELGCDLVLISDTTQFKDQLEGIAWTAKVLSDFQEVSGMNVSPTEYKLSEEELRRELLERSGHGDHEIGGLVDAMIYHHTNIISIQNVGILGEKAIGFLSNMHGHIDERDYKRILKNFVTLYGNAEVKVVRNIPEKEGFFYGNYFPEDHTTADEQIMVCAASFPEEYWSCIESFPDNDRQDVPADGPKIEGAVFHTFFQENGLNYVHRMAFNDTGNVLEDKLRDTQAKFNKYGIPTRIVYLNESKEE